MRWFRELGMKEEGREEGKVELPKAGVEGRRKKGVDIRD